MAKRSQTTDDIRAVEAASHELGSVDEGFLRVFEEQLERFERFGNGKEEFLRSVIASVEPRNPTEAMLAAQLSVTHVVAMLFGERATYARSVTEIETALPVFERLARLFAQQTQALQRLRTGGQQKVVVEYVNVGDGGQAVVGQVISSGDGRPPRRP